MHAISNLFRFQLNIIRRQKLIFLCVVAVAVVVLLTGWKHDTVPQSIVYLFTMWLCSLVIDFYALRKPAKEDFPVKNARRESFYVLVCAGLGFLGLVLRFNLLQWNSVPGLLRLGTVALMFLFALPLALAIIMLVLRYKPKDLGIRTHGIVLALPLIAIVAVSAHLVAPEAFTFDKIKEETGGSILAILFTGLITAGLSEEFFKMVAMTRLGKFWRNIGTGWFVSAIIWALLHVPKWYGEDKDLNEALLGAARIMPIGLMWSYMTYRTKSIVPATLVHGTNVWGLQNF